MPRRARVAFPSMVYHIISRGNNRKWVFNDVGEFGEYLEICRRYKVYCYHFNAIGSTIAVTDQTQAIVDKYAYDPFGNIANQVEAIAQPFRFVGQFGVMTEPNGFYYMKARYYDPDVGRFISEDPICFDGGDVNLMAYVGNNPVTLIDPIGEKAFFYHFGTTFVAGMKSGLGVANSYKLALGVMREDRNSTDINAPATNIHAMGGKLPSGRYQTLDQTIVETNSIIQQGSVFQAVHAAQDRPGHNLESMENWGWNWSTAKHILKDILPINLGYRDTLDIINSRKSAFPTPK